MHLWTSSIALVLSSGIMTIVLWLWLGTCLQAWCLLPENLRLSRLIVKCAFLLRTWSVRTIGSPGTGVLSLACEGCVECVA